MTLDRRQFLQLATAGLLASLTTAACARDRARDARALAEPELLGMLGADRVRELGERYRRMVPKERSAAALRAAILDGARGEARPSVAQQVRDDFAAGRIVLVDGWVLSATEARQCALFSLAAA